MEIIKAISEEEAYKNRVMTDLGFVRGTNGQWEFGPIWFRRVDER